MKGAPRRAGAICAAIAASAWACHGPDPDADAGDGGLASVTYTEDREPCSDRNPYRNAYFGDLHAHTAASIDAYAFGVHTDADDAYAFARGEPLAIPPLDQDGQGTVTVQLKAPLDFAAVTDHSEFLGETYLCTNPASEMYDAGVCEQYRTDPSEMDAIIEPWADLDPQRNAAFCGEDFERCYEALEIVWTELRDAAERASDLTSSCEFSAFVGYEYTASPGKVMLHRNVIFRNGVVPARPPSYFEETTPHGLWDALKVACAEAGDACDLLVIPHNSNKSLGKAFAPKYLDAATIEEERAIASERAEMEPVLEIYQHKGSSECSTSFSADEACSFEILPYPVCDESGEVTTTDCVARLDYYREILAEGMREERRLGFGVNPFRIGVLASTDTHNGTPGNTLEEAFVGHGGTVDADLEKRFEMSFYGPGGLAGVWAVENSRDALFEAIRRRETFGTSGTRIEVRLFGGWGFPADLCGDPELVKVGYERGVPMGAMLPAIPGAGAHPVFVATASRDETPLDRIQMVKVWIDASGETHERVVDIAGPADTAATVDTGTCVPTGEGASTLCGVWTDSDFDAAEPAAYYVRVLEDPTCRWTTFTCNGLPAEERPESCGTPEVIQERAWSSPIWFSPAE
jgi:hypothetical protein